MSVFDRIIRDLNAETVLYTPVKRKPFKIQAIRPNELVFFVGTKTSIPIPRAIWDDIPNFLRGKDWVRIGPRYDKAETGTLQEFIDRHPSRGTQHSSDANYVASVLEHLRIVDVKLSQTSRIKLR